MKKVTAALVALTLVSTIPAFAQDGRMNFFITSAGPGDGANLGGLEGADQQCTDLAYAAGLGSSTHWKFSYSVSTPLFNTPEFPEPLTARIRVSPGKIVFRAVSLE